VAGVVRENRRLTIPPAIERFEKLGPPTIFRAAWSPLVTTGPVIQNPQLSLLQLRKIKTPGI
jgi:hypothetical protein